MRPGGSFERWRGLGKGSFNINRSRCAASRAIYSEKEKWLLQICVGGGFALIGEAIAGASLSAPMACVAKESLSSSMRPDLMHAGFGA
jgi:hypothetical protein